MMRKKLRGLYRRGQRWYFKYKNADGKWLEVATRTNDYQEALRIRAEFLRELEEGRLPNQQSSWTLSQAVSEWLDTRKLRVARGTFLSECTITNTLQRILGKTIKLLELANPQRINQYQSQRLREGVCSKTINNEVQVLAGMLRDANLWHRLSGSYKPLKVKKSDVGQALTREEALRLMETALNAENEAAAPYAAVLSYSTGMRGGEIKKLQLGSLHLDENNPFLYVRRATTKTDSGARYVALDKIACWALRKLLTRARTLGATLPEHYLFPTALNKHTKVCDPLHGRSGYDPTHPQSSWSKEWNRLRVQAGILARRFHDLRHSYVTRAAEAGVPLPVTQAQVGHMSVQMVEHYTHVGQAAIHRAADQIEKNSQELFSVLGSALKGEPEHSRVM